MLNAKDIAIEFINALFTIFIVSGTILYFIAGDNFEEFKIFLKSLSPIAVFVLILLILIKIKRRTFKKRSKEGNLDLLLRLTYMDKIKADLIAFLTPVVILIIPLIKYGRIYSLDLIQALVCFIILMLWHKYIFGKED